MSTTDIPESRPPNRVSIPRWMALALALLAWLVAIPFAHGVIPWAISTLTIRYGWEEGHPGIWNWPGLIVIAVAVVFLIWLLVLGIAHTPNRVKLVPTPPFLMTRGPYSFTRNPMYVSELGLWLGWAIYFGSIGVAIGFVAVCLVVTLIVLPLEERTLEAAFGKVYIQYKNRVPRWFGRRQG